MTVQQPSKAAEAVNRSSREAVSALNGVNAELADLWSEKLKTWTAAMSVFGKTVMMPVTTYASLVNDVQEAAKSASEQVHENMEVLREGLQELGKCTGPAAYLKASTALQEKLAQQGAATSQRMMTLAGTFASRRMQANAALATNLIEKTQPRAP